MNSPSRDPALIKRILWERLGEHKYYREIREEKNRCIRLNYAGEFHMDVMPCIPDPMRRGWAVLVPDRKLAALKESNPWDFAEWFDNGAQLMPVFTRDFELFLANEKAASMEPLPEFDSFHKEPLRRFVQILKAHRDRYFEADPSAGPISIVVTTLAAQSYEFAVRQGTFDSVIDLFQQVVAGLDEHVLCIPKGASRADYIVPNPTNEAENFAERWCEDNALYENFLRWQNNCLLFISELSDSFDEGIDKVGLSLSNSVGDDLAKQAVKSFAKQRRQATKQGNSFVHSSGIITSGPLIIASKKMPDHTNFGKH
jgi:hypothetical protein